MTLHDTLSFSDVSWLNCYNFICNFSPPWSKIYHSTTHGKYILFLIVTFSPVLHRYCHFEWKCSELIRWVALKTLWHQLEWKNNKNGNSYMLNVFVLRFFLSSFCFVPVSSPRLNHFEISLLLQLNTGAWGEYECNVNRGTNWRLSFAVGL